MGNNQAKQKNMKSTNSQVTEHDFTRSSSYSSYDEGTSVDDRTSGLMPDRWAPMSSMEQYGHEETNPIIIMSGLPGETAPVDIILDQQEIARHSENLVMQVYPRIIKHGTKPELESSDELNEASHGALEEIGLDVNLGHSGERVIQQKCTTNVAESETKGQIETKFIKAASHKGATMLQYDGHCEVRTVPDENEMLKDIIKARDNLIMSVKLDPSCIYKKKITADSEDNRCSCNIISADSESKPPDKDIFSKVIFFPDKCRGASPKRYCPKRFGYDNIIEGENRNDTFGEVCSEHLNDDKGVMHTMDDISERKHAAGDIETIVSKKEQNDTVTGHGADPNTEIVEQVTFDENMNTHITDQENGHEKLIFVDDHFGLYTGSTATGVSKEFHVDIYGAIARKNVESNHMEQSKSTTVSHSRKEAKHDDSKQHEKDRLNILYSENKNKFDIQSHRDNAKCSSSQIKDAQEIGMLSQSNTETCNLYSVPDKSEHNSDCYKHETICTTCKEPRDMCMCLFPGINVVMSVFEVYQRKPDLSYLRYLRIYDKEINWPMLKNAQARFIKRLKSCNTDISEDNRLSFVFKLPVSKGFSWTRRKRG